MKHVYKKLDIQDTILELHEKKTIQVISVLKQTMELSFKNLTT